MQSDIKKSRLLVCNWILRLVISFNYYFFSHYFFHCFPDLLSAFMGKIVQYWLVRHSNITSLQSVTVTRGVNRTVLLFLNLENTEI